MNNNIYTRIQTIFESKKTFTICLPTNYNIDALAAGLALYLMLVKIGKQASITCLGNLNNDAGLVAVDKIKKSFSSNGDDLVISFPNKKGAVDQVNYGFEGDKFYIIIKPESGAEKLDQTQVKYSYSGGKPEVIITIDIPSLQSLGDLYNNNKDKFNGVEIINIDRHINNGNYGTINLIDKNTSSLSELLTDMFNALRLQLNKDIATNLYTGIAYATNNFTSYSTSATTFEAIALLIKNGAVKKQVSVKPGSFQQATVSPQNQTNLSPSPQSPIQPSTQPPVQPLTSSINSQATPLNMDSGQSSFQPSQTTPFTVKPDTNILSQQSVSSSSSSMVRDSQESYQTPSQPSSETPAQQPTITASVNGSEIQATPIEQVETAPQSQTPDNPPADWLKPKIFSGTKMA